LATIIDPTFYFTIEKPAMAEFKERGSKFIAFAYPIETTDDFKKLLQNLKKEHPKAVHHCFAYRIGTDGNINAYKTVTTLALQVVPVIQKQIEEKFAIHFDYTQMNEVMMVMKQYNCTVITQELQLFCHITAGIAKSRLQEVLYRLKELQQVDVEKIK